MLVENVPNSQENNAVKDKAKGLSNTYNNDAANALYHSGRAPNAPPRRLSMRARDAEGHVNYSEPVKTPRRRPSDAELLSHSQQQEKGGDAKKAAPPKKEGETFSEIGSDAPEAAVAAPVPLPHPTPTPTKTKAAATTKQKTPTNSNPADAVVVTTHRRVFEGNGWSSLLVSAYSTVERTVLNETSQATSIPDTSIRVVSLAMEGGRLVAEIALLHDATLTEAAVQRTLDTYPYNGMRMLLEMQEEKPQQPTGLGAVLAGMAARKDTNNANKSNNVINKDDADNESEVDSESLVLVWEKGEEEEDESPAEGADTNRRTATVTVPEPTATTPPKVPEVPTAAVVAEHKEIEFTEEPEPSVNAPETQKKKTQKTNKEKEVTMPRVPQVAGTHKHDGTATPKTPRTPQAAGTHKHDGTATPKTPRTPQAAGTHKHDGTATPKTPRTPQAAGTHKHDGTATPKTPRTPQAAGTHKHDGTATPKTPRTPQAAGTHKHDGTATPKTPRTPQAAGTHKHDGTATPKTPRTPQAAGTHKHYGTATPKTPRTPQAAGTHKHYGTATPKTPRTPRRGGDKAGSSSSTPRPSLTPRAGNPSDQANLKLPLRSPRAGSSRRRYSGVPHTARTYGSTTPRRRSAYDAGGRAVSNERSRSQTPTRQSRKHLQEIHDQGLACNALLERWHKTGVLRGNERPIPPQRVIRVGVSQWPRTPRVSPPGQASAADAGLADHQTPTVSAGVNGYATDHHGATVNDFEAFHDKYNEVHVPPVSAPAPVRAESNDHRHPHQYQPQPQPQRRHSPLKDTPGISHGLRSPVRHHRVQVPDEAVKKHAASESSSSISWEEVAVIEETRYA
ncbi:hypothetical protein LSM04_001720 [Trypanosoma melophagium]|uniref:uncharacterized protein n=1 Tax=Trypanosoma melophagium TaxID=715481 RepID=UPI00351A0C03|nr:hypothetical protein LSM04_001720 [Trypanosoma melophagium]